MLSEISLSTYKARLKYFISPSFMIRNFMKSISYHKAGPAGHLFHLILLYDMKWNLCPKKNCEINF